MQPVVNRNRVEQREKQGTEKYSVAHKHNHGNNKKRNPKIQDERQTERESIAFQAVYLLLFLPPLQFSSSFSSFLPCYLPRCSFAIFFCPTAEHTGRDGKHACEKRNNEERKLGKVRKSRWERKGEW